MPSDLKRIVEALLFAADDPLPGRKIADIVGGETDAHHVRRAVEALREEFSSQNKPYAIEELAGGFQLLTRKDYMPYINRLWKSRPRGRLSQPALETLAIVAYRQPIRKADIEAVRGVNVDQMLGSLMEKGLVKVVGKAAGLGRPLLYGTTQQFLKVFGLKSLKDLPKESEISPAAGLARMESPQPGQPHKEAAPPPPANTASGDDASGQGQAGADGDPASGRPAHAP